MAKIADVVNGDMVLYAVYRSVYAVTRMPSPSRTPRM